MLVTHVRLVLVLVLILALATIAPLGPVIRASTKPDLYNEIVGRILSEVKVEEAAKERLEMAKTTTEPPEQIKQAQEDVNTAETRLRDLREHLDALRKSGHHQNVPPPQTSSDLNRRYDGIVGQIRSEVEVEKAAKERLKRAQAAIEPPEQIEQAKKDVETAEARLTSLRKRLDALSESGHRSRTDPPPQTSSDLNRRYDGIVGQIRSEVEVEKAAEEKLKEAEENEASPEKIRQAKESVKVAETKLKALRKQLDAANERRPNKPFKGSPKPLLFRRTQQPGDPPMKKQV